MRKSPKLKSRKNVADPAIPKPTKFTHLSPVDVASTIVEYDNGEKRLNIVLRFFDGIAGTSDVKDIKLAVGRRKRTFIEPKSKKPAKRLSSHRKRRRVTRK